MAGERVEKQLIERISVSGLFGLYNYQLPSKGSLSNATILYGDNGVGKSTILQLAFHLLSAANDRGHRSKLYETEYKSLEILLSNGVSLSARKEIFEGYKVLVLEVREASKLLAKWNYMPPKERSEIASSISRIELSKYIEEMTLAVKAGTRKKKTLGIEFLDGETYIESLKKSVPNLFILTADRRLDSDTVSDPSDELEIRKLMRYEEPTRGTDILKRSREIALSQALNQAGRWISRKAFQSANQGSMNVHTVYENVLKQISLESTLVDKTIINSDKAELAKRLSVIEKRISEFAKYELESELSTEVFRVALNNKSKDKQDLIFALIRPYIESLESRLAAINPIYEVLDKFVETINSFLCDKMMFFRQGSGFEIRNRLGSVLQPSQLSSGEQQLLLLFCYVLVARDSQSVFMIDEPEISLNVKWQRNLVKSLLEIADNTNVQFVFASHSMELLAQHRERVVKVENSDE